MIICGNMTAGMLEKAGAGAGTPPPPGRKTGRRLRAEKGGEG